MKKVTIATTSVGIALLTAAAITFFSSPLYLITGGMFIGGILLIIVSLFLTLWS